MATNPDPAFCPRCRLPLASTDGATPTPDNGTMTVLPPDAASGPTPATPQPGVADRIGRFEVRRFLGEGAFGRVYEAYDPALKRAVALKVAKPEQTADERRVARFQREARSAGLLLHPNIVAVFDSGSDGPHHYIASAFVQGRPLVDVLEEGKALPPRQAVEIVRKLAEALAYAHQQGVVHRDVKPHNVMLRDDGEPLLMDFGLATRGDEEGKLTVAGQFMGTPAYTAPEQWRGEAIAASDQYALGCVLYELLTGRTPFAGRDAGHYLVLHTQAAVPSPRTLVPGLPRDLETIVLKCLEKEPGKRYADCAAVADDLRRWLAGEAISARRAGPIERLVRWARREPAMATLVGAVAALLVVGAVTAWSLAAWALHQKGEASKAAGEWAREATAARKAEKDAEDNADLAKKEEQAARKAEKEAKDNADLAKQREAVADYQALRAEDARHAIQMDLAMRSWEQHDMARAEQVLGEVLPRFQQTWETRHVRGLCRRKVMPLLGHTGYVNSVAYSPNGKRIVSGSGDKTVKVWDAATGQEKLTLKGHTSSVTSVAYSPDGKRIVSGSEDDTLKVWDAETGQEKLTLKGHTDEVISVAFSPDGQRIVSGSYDKTLKVWDAATGQEKLTLRGHTGRVSSVAYSPDGQRIVSGSWDNTLKVWDAGIGQETLSLKGHTSTVWSVAYSPDGKRIVSGSEDDTLKVWDAATGQEKLSLKGHTGGVTSVAFSPDGQRIVSGSQDKTLKVWDAATGQEKLSLKGHPGTVTSVAFSPDGKRIRSKDAYDKRLDWDAITGKSLPPDPGPVPAGPRAEHPDGKRIALAHGNDVVVFWRPPLSDADVFLRRQAQQRWHAQQAADAEQAKQWAAAAFNLERLHRTSPDPRVRQRLSAALKQAERSPLTQAIERNQRLTDAARVAAAVGTPPLALPGLPLP